MGSASGSTRMIINPRERAVSNDVNRAQSFRGADLAEVFRMLLDPVGNESGDGNTDPGDGGGNPSFAISTLAPLDARILNGLLVRPQIASINTLVDAGVAFVVNPDGVVDPDDSAYKLVRDPGVTNGTTLQLTANASGSTRIDVVECQRVDTVLETDNRDTFDPGTGLFAPALVNKVAASRFQYRIRLGTPGAGLPAMASGWLPLMVASVPNGAANWDAVTCWDVRPLAGDAVPHLSRNSHGVPAGGRRLHSMATGTRRVTGRTDASVKWWRAGGPFFHTTSAPYVDLAASGNQEPGFAATANRPFYVYCCFPGGLPRWMRYSDPAFGLRVPRGSFGIHVVSLTSASLPSNGPTAGVVMPTTLGLGGAGVTDAACVLAGMNKSGGTLPTELYSDGTVTWGSPPAGTLMTVVDPDNANWAPTDGVDYPSNARAVWVKFSLLLTDLGIGVDGTFTSEFRVYDKTGAAVYATFPTVGNKMVAASGNTTYQCLVRIPLDPSFSGAVARKVTWNINAVALSLVASARTAEVHGWEVGP